MSNQTPSSSSSKQNTSTTTSSPDLQGKTKVFILTPDLLKKLGIANKIPNLSTIKVAGNFPSSTSVKNVEKNLNTSTSKKLVPISNEKLVEVKHKFDNVDIKQENVEENSVKSKLLFMLTSKLQNETSTSTEIVKDELPKFSEKQINSKKDFSSDLQETKLLQEKKSEAYKLSNQEINSDNKEIDVDSFKVHKEHTTKFNKNIRLKSESSNINFKSPCEEIHESVNSIKIEKNNETVKKVTHSTCKQDSDLKTETPNTELHQKLNIRQTPVKCIKIVKQINLEVTKTTDISKEENANIKTKKSNRNVLNLACSTTSKTNDCVNPLESIQLTNCKESNNSNSTTPLTSSRRISIGENVITNNKYKCSKLLEENDSKIQSNVRSGIPIENITENVETDIKPTPRGRKRKITIETSEDEEFMSPIRKSSRHRRLSTIHSDYVTELKLHDGSAQKISNKGRKSIEQKHSSKSNKSIENKSTNKLENETKSDPNKEEIADLINCISNNINQENKQNNNSIKNKDSINLIVECEHENVINNESNNNLQNLTPNSNNEELNKQFDENTQSSCKKRIIIHENILITPPKTLEGTISSNLKNILNKSQESKLSLVVNTKNIELGSSKNIDTVQLTENNTDLKSSKSNETQQSVLINNTESTKNKIKRNRKKAALSRNIDWEDVTFKVKSPTRTYPVKLKGRLSTETMNTNEKSTDDEFNENNSSQEDNKCEISLKSYNSTNVQNETVNITTKNKLPENINPKNPVRIVNNKEQEQIIKVKERSLSNKEPLPEVFHEIKSPENLETIKSEVENIHEQFLSRKVTKSTLGKEDKNQMDNINIETYKMQLSKKLKSQILNINTETNSANHTLNMNIKPISKTIHSSVEKVITDSNEILDASHNTKEIVTEKNTDINRKILFDTLHTVKEEEDNSVKESKTENLPTTITKSENINEERDKKSENKNNLFTPVRKRGRPRKQKLILKSDNENEMHIKHKPEILDSSINTTTNEITGTNQKIFPESIPLKQKEDNKETIKTESSPAIHIKQVKTLYSPVNTTKNITASNNTTESQEKFVVSVPLDPTVQRIEKKENTVSKSKTENVSDINIKEEQEFFDSLENFAEIATFENNTTTNEEKLTDLISLTTNVQRVQQNENYILHEVKTEYLPYEHIKEETILDLPDSTEELIRNESNTTENPEEEKLTDPESRSYWFTGRRARGRPRKYEKNQLNLQNSSTEHENEQRDNIEMLNTENSPSTTLPWKNRNEGQNLEQDTKTENNYVFTPERRRGRPPKQKKMEPKIQQAPPPSVIECNNDQDLETKTTMEIPRRKGRPPKSKTEIPVEKKSNQGKKRKRDDSDKPKVSSEVTCAICNEVLKKSSWPYHTIKHNFLCWQVDEPPIDLNDKKLVEYILFKSQKNMRKHFKHFICPTCGDKKKSVLGFLAHLDVCQLTDEEKEAIMVACTICNKKVLPQSLKYHMNTHKQQQQTEVTEENNDDPNTTRTKRKAAAKAVNLIQEVTNNETAPNKACVDIFTGKKRYKKVSDTGSVFLNNGVIIKIETKFKQGFKECLFPNCTFMSDNFTEFKKHLNSCSSLESDDYICKLCLHMEKNENAIGEHIKDEHFGTDPYVSASESDDDDDDNDDAQYIDSQKKKTLVLPKPSSEYIKPTYKVAFLAKERRRTYNKVTSFLPALKWTSEFREKKFFKETFKNILCLSSKWMPVPLKDQEEYIARVIKSMSVNTCSVTHTFPNVQQQEHEWKEYDLYESNITNDTINIFCGGPVWAFAWLPTPENEICDQYLAVSVQKDFEATYKISESYSGKEIIQFWNFGALESNCKEETTPTLEFTIAHNHGMVWCMEWCPSGYYDIEDPNNDEQLQKLGLLALACSDGNISIYSIGKPSRNDNNLNMFQVKPVYKLILQESTEQLLGQWKYQATRVFWSKHSSHNIIAGGYTNGVVCLWDLTITSPLLRSEEDDIIILKPYHSFQAHSSAVSALILYPLVDKGQRWLLTGSWDRTFKYWDLNNTSAPFSTFGKRGIITDGVWISHWLCSFFAFDDVFSFGHTVTTVQNPRDFAFKQCSALASNSVVMSMSSSDWASSVAQGSLAGELTGSFPRTILMSYDIDKNLKCKRMLLSYNEIIDKTKKISERKDIMKVERKAEKFVDKDDKSFTKYLNNQDLEPYVEEPTTYVEAIKKYGLVFCDLEMENFSTFPEESFEIVKQSNRLREAPTELYPITSLNRVAWNPNKQAYLYIACGYQNGFVRIRCVRFMNTEGNIQSNSK